MTNRKHEVLVFIVAEHAAFGRAVAGLARDCAEGSDGLGLQDQLSGLWLGTEPVGGTITGALRQYNLPTARAPGDWPEPTVNGTVRL